MFPMRQNCEVFNFGLEWLLVEMSFHTLSSETKEEKKKKEKQKKQHALALYKIYNPNWNNTIFSFLNFCSAKIIIIHLSLISSRNAEMRMNGEVKWHLYSRWKCCWHCSTTDLHLPSLPAAADPLFALVLKPGLDVAYLLCRPLKVGH